jgi:hypothetical protein
MSMMADDFSLELGKVLTLTVVVKDKNILGPLLAWQNKERVTTEAGLKMLDNPIMQGLELQAIGLGSTFTGNIIRVRELLAELSREIGE